MTIKDTDYRKILIQTFIEHYFTKNEREHKLNLLLNNNSNNTISLDTINQNLTTLLNFETIAFNLEYKNNYCFISVFYKNESNEDKIIHLTLS